MHGENLKLIVCIVWAIKCWISLMHGVTRTFEENVIKNIMVKK